MKMTTIVFLFCFSIIWSDSTFLTTFLKEGMQKQAHRDTCSCRKDTIDNAFERRALGVSFEGYYTFVGCLDVSVSEVKKHAQS